MRAPDPLALPAVPPPAPDGHRLRDIALVALLVAAMLMPLAGLFAASHPATLRFENRAITPWPSWAVEMRWRDRAAALERAFADRFGGRDRLIEAHHVLNAVVFGRSPVPKVLIGSEGWLYFTGEDTRALDRFHRGVPTIADADLARVVDELAKRASLLATHGIAYVVTVVPDKATVYPQHLPAWVQRASATPLDRLAEALRRDGRVRFVDLRAPLQAASAREPTYHRTDSHWNVAGAAVGYEALLAALRDALPQRQEALAPRPLPDLAPDRYSGDLAAMLGLPQRFDEPDARPLWRLLQQGGPCGARDAAQSTGAREVHLCDAPRRPALVMWRDSMAIPLVPLLAPHFRRALFVAGPFDLALAVAERPDAVIEAMVERRMLSPLDAPVRPVNP